MGQPAFTAADRTYLAESYFTLDALCAGRPESTQSVLDAIARRLLPEPSYVLDDGTQLFPADYFVLADQAGGIKRLREHFELRYRTAGGDPADLDADWESYLDGTYGICLRSVAPETIVRKGSLVDSISDLLEHPAPADETWRSNLRREVWELDALERDFAPDYDRSGRFGRPPTRDLFITAPRERHPEAFDVAAARL